jgi:hypothetical protein
MIIRFGEVRYLACLVGVLAAKGLVARRTQSCAPSEKSFGEADERAFACLCRVWNEVPVACLCRVWYEVPQSATKFRTYLRVLGCRTTALKLKPVIPKEVYMRYVAHVANAQKVSCVSANVSFLFITAG